MLSMQLLKEIFQSSKIFLKYAFWNIISDIFYCIHIYIYMCILYAKRKRILYTLFLQYLKFISLMQIIYEPLYI